MCSITIVMNELASANEKALSMASSQVLHACCPYADDV